MNYFSLDCSSKDANTVLDFEAMYLPSKKRANRLSYIPLHLDDR